MSDYDEEEIETIVLDFYTTFDEVYETYGIHANRIIAECIFEDGENNEVTEWLSEREAREYIEGYISR